MTGRLAPGDTPPPLQRIDVVVPAHNEESRIGACLSSLHASATQWRHRGGCPVGLVVVLDLCTDGTAEVVDGLPFAVEVVSLEAGVVGMARAEGSAQALDATGVALAARWLAHTDADTVVPEDWIAQHAQAQRRGDDILLGSIEPDAEEFTPEEQRRWDSLFPPGSTRGNVYGANLGVRADRYRELGGFSPIPEHEDVDLVRRASDAGYRIGVAEGDPVITSARRSGRTEGGFAGFLRDTFTATAP